jgi:hypothetical protein
MLLKRIVFLIIFYVVGIHLANATRMAKDTTLATKNAVAKDSIATLNAKSIPSIVTYANATQVNKSYELKYSRIDSTLDGIHVFNPIYTKGNNDKYMGSLLSATQSLIFNPYKNIGVNAGINQYRPYELLPEDINYFKANKRYTDLFYTLGAKTEQILSLTHVQSITSNWNAGIAFRRMATQGFLNKQQNYVSNVALFTSYVSKNKRYHLFANGILNTVEVQENGGVSDDEAFRSYSGIQLNFPTNLTAAQWHQNSRSFNLTQSWDLGIQHKNNPVDTNEVAVFQPEFRITHTFSYYRKSAVFSDLFDDRLKYTNLPVDTITYDSLYYSVFNNRIGIENFSKFLGFTGGFNSQVFKYTQIAEIYHYTTYRVNYFVDGSVGCNNTKGVYWKADAAYTVYGRNDGDYLGSAKLGFREDDKRGYIGVKAISQLQSPDIIQNAFYSNFYQWSNDFNKTNASTAAFEYRLPKHYFGIELGYTTLQNYISAGFDATPHQYSQRFGVAYATVNKIFRWRNWNFTNNITYRGINGIDVVRVPDLLTYQALSYQNYLFKKALQLQLGVDARYNTFYYGDSYMPETSMFYRQNQFAVGGKPMVDVFINFRIKTARLFLKLENVTGGIGGFDYMVPHYPIANRVFKFGISWRFFD